MEGKGLNCNITTIIILTIIILTTIITAFIIIIVIMRLDFITLFEKTLSEDLIKDFRNKRYKTLDI